MLPYEEQADSIMKLVWVFQMMLLVHSKFLSFR